MTNILYQLYNVPITSTSNKNISREIKKNNFSYALIKDNHISFSNKEGVSYQDVVIDKANARSFIYMSEIKHERIFLLIYINKVIVYSGMVNKAEIENKLDLYKSKYTNETNYYVHNFDVDFSFLPPKVLLNPKINSHLNDVQYKVNQISEIKRDLNKPYRVLGMGFALVLLVIIAVSLYNKYEDFQRSRQAKVLVMKEVDHWNAYRMALKGPAIDTEVTNVFRQIKRSLLLPNTAIKKISYNNHLLIIELVNFRYPTSLLETWAKHNNYRMTAYDEANVTLQKHIQVKDISDGTIINANDVKAWLIDCVKRHDPEMAISFSNNKCIQIIAL